MTTFNQLVKSPRLQKVSKKKAKALQGSPQRKAVCSKVYIQTPKKPNSAKRKVAKIKFSNTYKYKYETLIQNVKSFFLFIMVALILLHYK
jgi:ribosomal protein S12